MYLGNGFSVLNVSDHIKGDLPYAWFEGLKVDVIKFTHKLLVEKYRLSGEEEFDIVGKTHVEAY